MTLDARTKKDIFAFIAALALLVAALWWSMQTTVDLLNADNPFIEAALEWGEALCDRDYDTLHQMGFRIFSNQPRPAEFDATISAYLEQKIGRGNICTAGVFFPASRVIMPPVVNGVAGSEAWSVEVRLNKPDPTHLFVRVVLMDDGRYLISPDEPGLEAISRWNGHIYNDSLSIELYGTYGGMLHLREPDVLEGETVWAIGLPYTVTGGALRVQTFAVRAYNAVGMQVLTPLELPLAQINEPPQFRFPLGAGEERQGTWWFTVPATLAPERVLLDIAYDDVAFSVEPVLPPPARRSTLGPNALSIASARLEQDASGMRIAVFSLAVDEALVRPEQPLYMSCEDFELRWKQNDVPFSAEPQDCPGALRFFAVVNGEQSIRSFNISFAAGTATGEPFLPMLTIIDGWSERPNLFRRVLFEDVLEPDRSGQDAPDPLRIEFAPVEQDAGDGKRAVVFDITVDLSRVDPATFFRWSCPNFQLRWQQGGEPHMGTAVVCPQSGDTYYYAPGQIRTFRLVLQGPPPEYASEPITLLFSRDWTATSSAATYTLYEGLIRQP